MWSLIAKYAVKIALYAVEHPEIVKGVVDTVQEVKAAKQSAK